MNGTDKLLTSCFSGHLLGYCQEVHTGTYDLQIVSADNHLYTGQYRALFEDFPLSHIAAHQQFLHYHCMITGAL